MNNLARTTALASGKTYPVGAAIVREKLLTPTSDSPEMVAAMVKREKGFNPAADDWEFLVINGSMTKIKTRQKKGACQQCHDSQKHRDFVFHNPQAPAFDLRSPQ